MKVLQINTVCGNGSVGRITADIARTLKDDGDDCLIAYGRRSAPADVNAWRFGSTPVFGRMVLDTFLTGSHAMHAARQTDRLIRKIKEYGPDVIQMHNLHGFYLDIERLFAYLKEAGIPIVWTLHDCWSFTGHCAYFDYAGCERWKEGCEKCPIYRSSYPYALFHDGSKANYRVKRTLYGQGSVPKMTFVTPSAWLKDLVGESFLSDYPCEVIPNGIDLTKFSPDADAAGLRKKLRLEGKFILLGVANAWEQRKGFSCFLELAKKVPSDVTIILIGLDKKKQQDLPANIIGIDHTDSVEELAQYYAMADLYVNATLEDNFPTTNLEALACGTPVLTFQTGGSPESLNEDCGIVVPKGDVDALAGAALRVKTTPNLFDPKKIREHAILYDKNICFRTYAELYRKLCNK